MIVNENEIGLGYGLNRRKGGFFRKIGKQISIKNIKKAANLKNLIQVGTLAASFVPVGGAVAGKLAGKLDKLGKVGRLAKGAVKLANTQVGKMVIEKAKQGIAMSGQENQVLTQIAVANDVDTSTPNVLEPQEFEEVTQNTNLQQANAPVVNSSAPANVPNDAQLQTIANLKNIPAENLKEEVATTTTATTDVKKDNTMLYLGAGAVAVIGIALAMSKGSSTQTN